MGKKSRMPAAATVKLLRDDLNAVEILKQKWGLFSLNRTETIRLVLRRALAAAEKEGAA